MIAADLHALQAPIDSLHQLPGNPRRGDVDVICRRWQDFTGAKPMLESSGDLVDFTAT